MIERARPARPDDLGPVVELGRAARRELGEYRGGALWAAREAVAEPLALSYARLIDTPSGRLVVGTLDDVVLGYGVGEVEDLPGGRRLGRVQELYVDPGARGVGLGEVLLGELLAWFADQGCGGIDATALPGHRQAKNFFEEQGFVARLLVMHHAPEPAAPAEAPGTAAP
jgi:GNAT superfamily N-acetyltransferase